MFFHFWLVVQIYSIFISVLYPICTSRNEVQNMELSFFILQHSATYSYTLQHSATCFVRFRKYGDGSTGS